MSSTYYLGATNSDLSGGREFSKYLEEITETAGTISLQIPSGTSYGDPSYAFTRTDIPLNDSWETGEITVKVNITDGGNGRGFLKVSASRVNSSGVVQETTSETAEQALGSIGVLTFTIPSMNWSAGSLGDRLRINYYFRSNHNVQDATCTIQTGTTDTEVITPITIDPFEEPEVETNTTTSITRDSATLNGNLISLGETGSVEVYFRYRKLGGSWVETAKNSRSTTGTFEQNVSGLDHTSTYEVEAVVEYTRNGDPYFVYGGILEFDTKEVYSSTISIESNSALSIERRKLVKQGVGITSNAATSANLYVEFFVEIERKIGEGEWQSITKVYEENKDNPESFIDNITEFEEGVIYYYRARRYEQGEYLRYSNTLTIEYEEVKETLTGETHLQSNSNLVSTGRKLQKIETAFKAITTLSAEGKKYSKGISPLTGVTKIEILDLPVIPYEVHLRPYTQLSVHGRKQVTGQSLIESNSGTLAEGSSLSKQDLILSSTSNFILTGKAFAKTTADFSTNTVTSAVGKKLTVSSLNIITTSQIIMEDNILLSVVITTEEATEITQSTAEVHATISIPEGWWG